MNTKNIVNKIIKLLQEGPYQDLSDVGNLIGIAIGYKKVPVESDDGNDFVGFKFGLEHGYDIMTKPLTSKKNKGILNGNNVPG